MRCCYHGWLFDVDGKVLETPGEGPTSTFKERVRQPAYKVQELGGVLFVYMGPEPAPLLPRYDVLARQDGQRAMRARIVNCNYFQMIENSVDQNHLKWLHRGLTTPTWEDGEINPQIFDHGVLNTYTRRVAGKNWAHVNFFVMPTINKTGNVEEGHPTEHRASSSCEVMRWRVPIDDTSTIHYTVEFANYGRRQDHFEADEGLLGGGCAGHCISVKYRWDEEIGWLAREDQDRAAQESQGVIFDRTTEHLVTTDKGVILLRKIYKDGMEAIKQGRDPLGVVRDPAKNELIRLEPREETVGLIRSKSFKMFKPFKSFGETGFVQGSRSSGSERAMKFYCQGCCLVAGAVFASFDAAAETLEQLIAGAKKESGADFHRRGADFWRAEDFESARSGVQQTLRSQHEDPFCRRAGDELDGGAGDHRAEKRQQSVERYLSRLAVSSVAVAQRESTRAGQLFGGFSVDHQADGNISSAKAC